MRIRLTFAHWQQCDTGIYAPMWHVICPGNKFHLSTLSLIGLKHWGLI